ncbi:helix-turn-helix domain-containing protein [Levilactobacillus cerevisiae]|uniref:helix-turn-helix domain-containing protein n=1 Tax=Levilactobacillus cerevisiae TaxID=1704076 RepID=UPI000F774E2E|nr:helix-turn-helix transcriptional regulator [Levilactobacillus cerevisiae]
MNIDIFIETRKRLHLSQDQLAHGICTQATLSKFERNGKVPSLKILLQLCDRLELTLNDLFPLNHDEDSVRSQALEQAEFQLLVGEYAEAQANLKKLGDPANGTLNFQMRYYFIRGYVTALNGGAIADALYDFSQILNRFDEGHHSVYSLLAYTGMGVAYNQDGDTTRAAFYFNKVAGEIRNLTFKNSHNIWRSLNIIYYTGQFYGQTGDLKASDELLNYGVEVCARYHVTYYLARILYQRALNTRQQAGDTAQIKQDLQDAAAFARLNRNDNLLTLIANFDQN